MVSTQDTTDHLTVRQASQVIGIEIPSVRRAILQGRLKATKKQTHTTRYGFYYLIEPSEAFRYRDTPSEKGGGRPKGRKARAQ